MTVHFGHIKKNLFEHSTQNCNFSATDFTVINIMDSSVFQKLKLNIFLIFHIPVWYYMYDVAQIKSD